MLNPVFSITHMRESSTFSDSLNTQKLMYGSIVAPIFYNIIRKVRLHQSCTTKLDRHWFYWTPAGGCIFDTSWEGSQGSKPFYGATAGFSVFLCVFLKTDWSIVLDVSRCSGIDWAKRVGIFVRSVDNRCRSSPVQYLSQTTHVRFATSVLLRRY